MFSAPFSATDSIRIFLKLRRKMKMAFERRSELWTYDVFPKVIEVGKPAAIHINYAGGRRWFTPGENYNAVIRWLPGGRIENNPPSGIKITVGFTPDENGCFTVDAVFPREGEYSIEAEGCEGDRKRTAVFAVYAVEGELVGKYPFIGDLHMHTCCSDGNQTPEAVAAAYRGHGYDFLAITDHRRYYPSLRAVESFKNIPTDYTLVPGEEVHLPDINGFTVTPHTINFGGEYSINALIEGSCNEEAGTDKKYRSVREVCPEVMTKAEFAAKMTALAKEEEKNCPANVDPRNAAVLRWLYNEIRNAGGLAIFPHPTWITGNTFHVSDAINDWLVDNNIFDAFEVLGGENYFEQNGYQTVRYYEDRAKGKNYPIVGSTDSHSCTPENRNGFICSTIVFSPENERQALIDSIKAFRSVAVDTISREFRLVGEMRLVRYGCFLLKNWFPIHDDACFEEGRLMKLVFYGTADEKKNALATLEAMNGRMKAMREKYFAF